MDEHDNDQGQIKSPMKRYGSTRKICLYNSKYLCLWLLRIIERLFKSCIKERAFITLETFYHPDVMIDSQKSLTRRSVVNYLNTCKLVLREEDKFFFVPGACG